MDSIDETYLSSISHPKNQSVASYEGYEGGNQYVEPIQLLPQVSTDAKEVRIDFGGLNLEKRKELTMYPNNISLEEKKQVKMDQQQQREKEQEQDIEHEKVLGEQQLQSELPVVLKFMWEILLWVKSHFSVRMIFGVHAFMFVFSLVMIILFVGDVFNINYNNQNPTSTNDTRHALILYSQISACVLLIYHCFTIGLDFICPLLRNVYVPPPKAVPPRNIGYSKPSLAGKTEKDRERDRSLVPQRNTRMLGGDVTVDIEMGRSQVNMNSNVNTQPSMIPSENQKTMKTALFVAFLSLVFGMALLPSQLFLSILILTSDMIVETKSFAVIVTYCLVSVLYLMVWNGIQALRIYFFTNSMNQRGDQMNVHRTISTSAQANIWSHRDVHPDVMNNSSQNGGFFTRMSAFFQTSREGVDLSQAQNSAAYGQQHQQQRQQQQARPASYALSHGSGSSIGARLRQAEEAGRTSGSRPERCAEENGQPVRRLKSRKAPLSTRQLDTYTRLHRYHRNTKIEPKLFGENDQIFRSICQAQVRLRQAENAGMSPDQLKLELEKCEKLPEITNFDILGCIGSHCAICLVDFEVSEKADENAPSGCFVRTLPCLHTFHSECSEHWLRTKPFCPLCRKHVGK